MKLKEITEKYGLTPESIDYALTQYQIVICEITRGMLSKLSYDAKDIIRIAQERWCDTCDLKIQKPIRTVTSEAQYKDHLRHCPSCEKALPNSGEYGKSQFTLTRTTIADWRPACDMYIDDICFPFVAYGKNWVRIQDGIRFWLENGDSIIYVKSKKDGEVK